MGNKTIYLLRHAKAVAAGSHPDDHARELAGRGRREAAAMGVHLAGLGVLPQRVLCSTSVRTRETLELFFKTAKQPPVEFSEKLYLASPNEILSLLQALPEEVERVLVIGHSPGIHMFCQQMAREGEEKALDELNDHFPTCTFAEINVDDAVWATLRFGQGYLARMLLPGDVPVLAA